MKTEDLQEKSDGEIVGLFKENQDRRCLSILYTRYSEAIYRKCFAMVKSDAIAKDLSHDIFLKSFMKISTLQSPEKYGFWLKAIAYNTCINHLNMQASIRKVDVDEQYDLQIDNSDTEKKLWQEMTLEILEKIIEKLPEMDRMLLLMRYQDEMSIKQIQAILGIGESATKMRLKRAKEKLKIYFEEYKTPSI